MGLAEEGGRNVKDLRSAVLVEQLDGDERSIEWKRITVSEIRIEGNLLGVSRGKKHLIELIFEVFGALNITIFILSFLSFVVAVLLSAVATLAIETGKNAGECGDKETDRDEAKPGEDRRNFTRSKDLVEGVGFSLLTFVLSSELDVEGKSFVADVDFSFATSHHRHEADAITLWVLALSAKVPSCGTRFTLSVFCFGVRCGVIKQTVMIEKRREEKRREEKRREEKRRDKH